MLSCTGSHSHPMQHSTASFQKRRWLLVLLLLPLSLFSALVPAAAHTYPNYVFPPSVRTSHASSALALSGEKIAIISPLPRRAFGVVDGNLSFAVQMLRTCSSSSSSKCEAAAACTARCILTGLRRAIFLSLAMKQSQLLSQLQLPVRALASFITNSASLPFRFRRRRDDCCILLHRPSSRRPHHHVDSDNATAGLSPRRHHPPVSRVPQPCFFCSLTPPL